MQDKITQYDIQAKKILSYKEILAYLSIELMPQYKNMNIEEVIPLIDDPSIGHQIVGQNTEDYLDDYEIIYDIKFSIQLPNKKATIIVNVEAQKDDSSHYHLLHRMIYYACRLISSQKGKEFTKSYYDNMKEVYSIWLIMNQNENTLNHINLHDVEVIGNYHIKGNIQLMHIFYLRISNKIAENHNILRLLGTLFSLSISKDERKNIIENEYHIMNDHLKKEVDEMCNLGEGVYEQGIEQGITQGITQGQLMGELAEKVSVLKSMLKENFDEETILRILNIDEKTLDELKKKIG